MEPIWKRLGNSAPSIYFLGGFGVGKAFCSLWVLMSVKAVCVMWYFHVYLETVLLMIRLCSCSYWRSSRGIDYGNAFFLILFQMIHSYFSTFTNGVMWLPLMSAVTINISFGGLSVCCKRPYSSAMPSDCPMAGRTSFQITWFGKKGVYFNILLYQSHFGVMLDCLMWSFIPR